MKTLSSKEMELTLNTFIESVNIVKNKLSPVEVVEVKEWLTGIIMYNPSTILTNKALTEITNTIFSNEIVRDYVFNTAFTFYMLNNIPDEDGTLFTDRLNSTITNAFKIFGKDVFLPSNELNQILSMMPWPSAIDWYEKNNGPLDSSKTASTVVCELLDSNRHIVICLLIWLTHKL